MRRLLTLLRALIHEATAEPELVLVFDGGPLDGLQRPATALIFDDDREALLALRPGLAGTYRHHDGDGHVRLVTA